MRASETDAARQRSRWHAAIWILIYGGLLALGLGLFLAPQAALLRVGFLGGGSLAALAGVALIVIRSRQARS